jgi:hypothetical protein
MKFVHPTLDLIIDLPHSGIKLTVPLDLKEVEEWLDKNHPQWTSVVIVAVREQKGNS